MRQFSIAVGCLVAVLVAVEAGVALAGTMTLEATTDVYVREQSPYQDTTYDDAGSLSVWALGVDGNETVWGDGSNRRLSAVTFDLSGVSAAITDAHLELYALNDTNTTRANSAFRCDARTLLSSDIDGLTWTNMWASFGSMFETFGYYTIAANSPTATWYSSAASANDLVKLESARTTGSGMLSMLLGEWSGAREWGDSSSGFAPRLVLTTAVPEPSTSVLATAGLIGLLAYAWRRWK